MDGGPQEREQHPRGQLSVYETGESAATHPLHPGNPGLFSNEDRPVLLSLLSCPSTRRLTQAVVVDPRGSGRKGDLLISHPLPPRQLETHRGSRHGTGCPFPSLLTHHAPFSDMRSRAEPSWVLELISLYAAVVILRRA